MICIIDYGLGNITAFINSFKRLNTSVKIVKRIEDLDGATKIIIPGVGSFDKAMTLFNNSGLRPAVEKLVMVDKVSVVGICVGMQILAKSSEEGNLEGLGWIDAKVKKLCAKTVNEKILLPHMGWNQIEPNSDEPMLKGLNNNSRFYFLHSFYMECVERQNEIAYTNYHGQFCCAVRKENIYGIQFHPEKSHHNGLLLLKNFLEL